MRIESGTKVDSLQRRKQQNYEILKLNTIDHLLHTFDCQMGLMWDVSMSCHEDFEHVLESCPRSRTRSCCLYPGRPADRPMLLDGCADLWTVIRLHPTLRSGWICQRWNWRFVTSLWLISFNVWKRHVGLRNRWRVEVQAICSLWGHGL